MNNNTSPQALLHELLALREKVILEANQMYDRWGHHLKDERKNFKTSSLNFAHYLALRHHDLRPLQSQLRVWGLSSLGRIEAQVLPMLDSVIVTLSQMTGIFTQINRPSFTDFDSGSKLLDSETTAVFGKKPTKRRVRMMVTLPSEASNDYTLVKNLLVAGMNIARINCAHDTTTEWEKMITHLKRAESETGLSCKIAMDLGGPKSRTADVVMQPKARIFMGDKLLLAKDATTSNEKYVAQARCTLETAIDQVKIGAKIFFDDGKIGTVVREKSPNGLELEVVQASPDGDKLKNDKGINFPDTDLELSPLTEQDLQDLDFLVQYADMVNYSFVQSGDDIRLIQKEIMVRAPKHPIALIAKIETAKAIKHLPEIIIAAGGQGPFGVMIARGDLAVEIGFERLAEMQEEILWLCEAAHVPVIWATQVLETLAKEGRPSRAEMTDAAMAERAECVMLNKGPYILDAMRILDSVLSRMETHQTKKMSQLRALKSW